jgi:hypothetical protein
VKQGALITKVILASDSDLRCKLQNPLKSFEQLPSRQKSVLVPYIIVGKQQSGIELFDYAVTVSVEQTSDYIAESGWLERVETASKWIKPMAKRTPTKERSVDPHGSMAAHRVPRAGPKSSSLREPDSHFFLIFAESILLEESFAPLAVHYLLYVFNQERVSALNV